MTTSTQNVSSKINPDYNFTEENNTYANVRKNRFINSTRKSSYLDPQTKMHLYQMETKDQPRLHTYDKDSIELPHIHL